MAKNATSFKKGDPRIYRKGRPKGSKSFTTKVREALQVLSGVKDNGVELTYEQLLAKKIVTDAIKDKDTSLRRLMWNYLDGMPRETKDVNVTLPKPILEYVSSDNSNKEDNEDDQEDQGGTRGDISE